jgi:acyl-CoA hydrolase/N-acetylglutamate synthase-like GNAT family acetyltransferase
MVRRPWQEIYAERTVSAPAALARVRSGSRVFVAAGCGRPECLMQALLTLPGKVADLELIHYMTLGLGPYASTEFERRFRHNTLFLGSDAGNAVSSGRADFTPIGKFRIAKLFRSGRIPLDAALIQVTPPNEQGYVSMGITVGISKTAAECARFVVAEVNPRMPRTLGNSFLHVSQIDAFVPCEHDLIEAPPIEVDPVSGEIARHAARLIEDRATIHLGYDAVAFALPRHLSDRRDLGIHSDILTAPLLEMIRSGVVTNAAKTLHPQRTITSLCYGTAADYAYVADNPQIEFHPCEYVNDPFVIAQNDHMVAINQGHQVDLTGLACAKFQGPRFGSGFMYGASFARYGKSIVALPSTSPDGQQSNIVLDITSGQGLALSTNRDAVGYVVTEYGIADLVGKTVRERALALIHIAHPAFREELMRGAKERHYVYADQLLPRGRPYPDHLERWHPIGEGLQVFIRPAVPTDERGVQSFLYGLDEESIRYRFHGRLETVHHSLVQHVVNVDYDETMTVLALTRGSEGQEEVVGIAQYLFYPALNQAEAAFLTAESYRNRGIGTALLQTLICLARERGIRGFFAEVLSGNRSMLRVFHKGGVPLESMFDSGVYSVKLDLTAEHADGEV